MRSISVQVQPERYEGINIQAITCRFEAIAEDTELVREHDFSSGDDDGPYFNFSFGTTAPLKLWAVIQRELYADPEVGAHMQRASMAMCSAEDGWDDYLQLYHFDLSVELDSTDSLDD